MKTKKNRGSGLSPPGKNQNRNHFVFLSFGVDPLNWQSFTEIGEMACSTAARYSGGHTLNRSCFLQVRRSRLKVVLFPWQVPDSLVRGSRWNLTSTEVRRGGRGEGLKTGNRVASLDGGLRLKPGSLLFFLFYSSYAPQVKQNKMSSSWKVARRNIIILGFFVSYFWRQWSNQNL